MHITLTVLLNVIPSVF